MFLFSDPLIGCFLSRLFDVKWQKIAYVRVRRGNPLAWLALALKVWPVGAPLSLHLMLMVSVDTTDTFTSDKDQRLMVLLLLWSYCGSSFHAAPYGSCLRAGHDSVSLFVALAALVRLHKTPSSCRNSPDVYFWRHSLVPTCAEFSLKI